MDKLLRWRALVGGRALTGVVDGPDGAVRIRCDAPAGTIQAITAILPWEMGKDERAFLNGYQTWTYCPECGKRDKIRGLAHVPKPLLDKYAFDRYGDYHFVDYPNKRGLFHGFSWCYFRRGERFCLIASLDERPGYTIFRYDANRGLLAIERDCAGVEHPGGTLHAFDLYVAEGTETEVFDGWFAAMGVKPRTGKKLAGYSSWYNRYQDITQETISSDLAGCKTLLSPGDLFQVDDGWEPQVGDWLEPDSAKFPRGMKSVAEEIHDAGFLAGLWLAPFVCETDSNLYREHPDWLLKVNGQPWKCGGNWSGFYALDIDLPAVRDYLRGVFDRVLDQWGFDLVKLDFLYGAAPFGKKTESRAGRMIRAMELLREWCGDKLILGCGVPVGAFLMTEKVGAHSLVAGDHGSTYGGNPLACAAVSRVIDLFEKQKVLENVKETGACLGENLKRLVEEFDCVKEHRGVGLLQGLVFDRPVGDIITRAMDRGLVLINAGTDIIRFVPPLVITKAHVDEMMRILRESIRAAVYGEEQI